VRPYYNQRIGQGSERPRLELGQVARQVAAQFSNLEREGHFQRSFGYNCVDAGDMAGVHGSDLRTHFYVSTGLQMPATEPDFLANTDEVGLFTFIEFVHDHIAKPDPKTGYFHPYMQCGWHFDSRTDKFDIEGGRGEWRGSLNGLLKFYGDGFELSALGEIMRLAPDGLTELLQRKVPSAAGEKDISKINNAVHAFLRGLASREDQKQAVRQLAAVLEFYRPMVKELLLKEDEAALFNIANNFAIRHNNANQRDEYDGPWLTWLFYLYLSTTHLVLTLIHGAAEAESGPTPETTSDDLGPPSDDDIPF
jgi:hypothetical protein